MYIDERRLLGFAKEIKEFCEDKTTDECIHNCPFREEKRCLFKDEPVDWNIDDLIIV